MHTSNIPSLPCHHGQFRYVTYFQQTFKQRLYTMLVGHILSTNVHAMVVSDIFGRSHTFRNHSNNGFHWTFPDYIQRRFSQLGVSIYKPIRGPSDLRNRAIYWCVDYIKTFSPVTSILNPSWPNVVTSHIKWMENSMRTT